MFTTDRSLPLTRSEEHRLLKKQGDRKTTGDKALDGMDPFGWKHGVVYMVSLEAIHGAVFLLMHWEILEERVCEEPMNHV